MFTFAIGQKLVLSQVYCSSIKLEPTAGADTQRWFEFIPRWSRDVELNEVGGWREGSVATLSK